MFREYFCGSLKSVGFAWIGLAVVIGYSFFVAQVKAQLNEFYGSFYDLLGEGGTNLDAGSGDVGSGEGVPALHYYRERVTEELWRFAFIIAPLVSASPMCKYVRSAWALQWRMSLMEAYLAAWDTKQEPIEGASQRLHEDTQRFANGLDGCLVTVLDAAFTLALFTPILVSVSAEIASPVDLGALNDAWLWALAFTFSLIGLAGAAFFGQKLVGLEVSNQRVEALLRKDLVLLETTPAVIVGTDAAAPPSEHPPRPELRHPAFLPQTYFLQTLKSLSANYFALFKHFAYLNFWLSLFDQVMVILPYLLVAPRIFSSDPEQRITLGLLMKIANAFGHVFGSLSVISENWGAINEFRSVLRRLREFESTLYAESRGSNLLLTDMAMQMTEMTPRVTRTQPPDDGSSPPPTPVATGPAPASGGDAGPSGACSDAPYPIVDGINPESEASAARGLSRRGRAGPRAARAEGLPIEIHVECPPDVQDMRV